MRELQKLRINRNLERLLIDVMESHKIKRIKIDKMFFLEESNKYISISENPAENNLIIEIIEVE